MSLSYFLKKIKEIIKTKIFIFGLVVRVSSILVLLIFMNFINDLNDMNEIIYKGLNYLSRGINPYGQWYFLKIFNYGFFEGHNQNYFGYGPFIFILYLPTLLCPSTLASIGTMDFMPAFVIMNNIFDFAIFYHFQKNKCSRTISWIYWVNPIIVLVGVFSFFNSIFLLLTLGFIYLEKPRLSALYFSLAVITYQYTLFFLAFILVYHKNKLKDFFTGLLPALFILGIFFLWEPNTFINDVFLTQFKRDYISWTSIWARDAPIAYSCSIPAIIYNLTGGGLVVSAYIFYIIIYNLTGNPFPPLWYPYNFQFDFGIKTGTYLTYVTIFTFLILLLHNFIKRDRDRTFDYMILIYSAVILSNQTGLYHYWFILLIPLFFYYKKSEFYSEIAVK